jgi:hypothetical protein
MAVEFPIVVKHKDITLRLYNWMNYPQSEAIRNIEAFDSQGKSLWVIEPLGDHAVTDFYTSVASLGGNIHAFNFQCFDCVIDEESGKVLSISFTK